MNAELLAILQNRRVLAAIQAKKTPTAAIAKGMSFIVTWLFVKGGFRTIEIPATARTEGLGRGIQKTTQRNWRATAPADEALHRPILEDVRRRGGGPRTGWRKGNGRMRRLNRTRW